MSKDIFISYSRKDQEFVSRLAADLNEHVAGVWFDQSTIRAGQKWHDEIMEGIRECKAFVLVLSPDATQSHYVREELDSALELGKPIFPVIYHPARWKDEFASLVKDIQTINLHSGSYTDNFHILVDGLLEVGAARTGIFERPAFLRQPTKISLWIIFRKALGWALAWSIGWLIFSSLTFIVLFFIIALQHEAGSEDVYNFLTVSISGMSGGFAGGLVAGTASMVALRPYAPSIFWKHMSPTILIWAIHGPLGIIISGIITTIMLIAGVISTGYEQPSCQRTEFVQCLSQIYRNAYQQDIATIFLIAVVFMLLMVAVWFLAGTFAGWFIVHQVRRLEPGITTKQGWGVSTGWGCGAIIAAIGTVSLIAIIANIFHL